MEKEKWTKPVAEKVEFDYSDQVVASGGNPYSQYCNKTVLMSQGALVFDCSGGSTIGA